MHMFCCTLSCCDYHQTSNISHTKSPNLNVSPRFAVVFAQSTEGRCQVKNEDVVGTALTGNAPNTSEWSTNLLFTKAQLILEFLWSLVNSLHKGQWRGALIFSFICVWINGWVNIREAGDLWCYHAHYDITVMHMVHPSSLLHWHWRSHVIAPVPVKLPWRI